MTLSPVQKTLARFIGAFIGAAFVVAYYAYRTAPVKIPVATPMAVEDLDADGRPDDQDSMVLLPDGTVCVPTASLPAGGSELTMHVSSAALGWDEAPTIKGVVRGTQTCYTMPAMPSSTMRANGTDANGTWLDLSKASSQPH